MRREQIVIAVGLVYFLAALLFLWKVPPDFSRVPWGGVLFFAGLIALAEFLRIPLPRGKGAVSVTFPLGNAMALLFGPGIAAVVAGLATLDAQELSGKVKWHVILFNRAQLSLSAGLAGVAYLALGGTPGTPELARDLLPSLASALVMFLVNVTSSVLFLSLRDRMPLWDTWLLYVRYIVPNYLGTAPLGIILATVFNSVGYLGAAYFFLPLLVAQHAFKLQNDMRRAFLGTISALTAALDAKDPYTAGHSERVGELAARIGRAMGLPENRVELLRYAGILHDVGKIGIRDQVLLKPGRFTPEEYAEMKNHPVLSGRILANAEAMGEVGRWVAHHHEHWNGQGYPDGLTGERIPLEARVIAVCDAFDAMLSRRTYKESLPWEAACAELRRCAGQQFDPQVVDVLLGLAADPGFRQSMVTAVETAQAQAAMALEGGRARPGPPANGSGGGGGLPCS